MSAVALVGSEYISQVIFKTTPDNTTRAFIAMIPIAVFYCVNLLGLRMSSTAQNILMIIKIGMLLLLISSIFFITGDTNSAVTPAFREFTTMDYIRSFGIALIAVSFTYGGYQQTINFGEEVNEPRKTIPKGIFIGILMIIILYLSVSYAYYNAIGFEQLKTSRGIASIVAERMFGTHGQHGGLDIIVCGSTGLCQCIAFEQSPCNVCDEQGRNFAKTLSKKGRKERCADS
jgi:APA family basic amino acid/polyamine antiporter